MLWLYYKTNIMMMLFNASSKDGKIIQNSTLLMEYSSLFIDKQNKTDLIKSLKKDLIVIKDELPSL